MQFGKWLGKRRPAATFAPPTQQLTKAPRRKVRREDRALGVEALEDRRMLAVFLVNNTFDLDPDDVPIVGSLRQAVELANATEELDTIVFDDVVFTSQFGNGGVINLNGGQIDITQPLRILGPGPGNLGVGTVLGFPAEGKGLTIRQNTANSRVFNLDIGDEDEIFTVEISGVTITGGAVTGTSETDDLGGGIFNRERLTMNEVIIANNFASQGGGGVFTAVGSTTIDRSLIIGNSAGNFGGGVLNGPEGEPDNAPSTLVTNSTITGNTASGGDPYSAGGGLFNRIGFLDIESSTIYSNSAYYGSGLAAMGNPVPEDEGDDPPPPTVFTTFTHSVIYTDPAQSGGAPDVASVGMTDDDEPMPLLPSIVSLGFSAIGVAVNITNSANDITGVSGAALNLLPLADYGGSTPVFYPNNNNLLGPTSILIDAGDSASSQFEQRGRHFRRQSGVVDIGAVEVQEGRFVVDALIDEKDGQYSGIFSIFDPLPPPVILIDFDPYGSIGQDGDFALREAIEFSEKNPEVDTIQFWAGLTQPELDPTASEPPTILINQFGEDPRSGFLITQSVNIEGPEGFELEIDAGGLDPTPISDNADGGRIFRIDDGDFFNNKDVRISDLTLLGGDVLDRGGAIYNVENLTIANSTVKENFASADGAGIFSQIGDLVVDSSTIHNNRAANSGGGIYVDTGLPGNTAGAVVRNSTLSGNLAGNQGGGLLNYNGEVLIEFSTITQNQAASTRGSGVASLPGPTNGSLTQVRSSIISDNSSGDIEFLNGPVSVQSLGFNLIGDGNALVAFNQPGDLINVTDPMLGPLTVTGGLRPTHRPLPGSPVIDAGDSEAVAGENGVPLTDQRGNQFTRVFDGLQDTKDRIDIGAYELQPTVFIVDSSFDENDGDFSQGNLSLREAIAISNANPLTDTITFSPNLIGSTIAIGGGFLQPGTDMIIPITDSVSIEGLGRLFLTIDGSLAFDPNGKVRLFDIDDSDLGNQLQVSISDLSIIDFDMTLGVGGAIMSHEDLTLQRVSLVNNSTLGPAYSGGAVYQRYGDLTLENVTLTGNSTNGEDSDGGAVFVRDGDLTVNNSTISGNSTAQTRGSGGGIYLRNGTLDMSYSSVAGNTTPAGAADGAGLFGYNATLNIADSSISGNAMSGSNSEGAGIHSRNSVLTFTNGSISLNSTTGTNSEGAGLYVSGGSATLNNVTMALNSTAGNFAHGGAIANAGGTVVVNGSTIDGNFTTGLGASGGGIHNLEGNLTVVDSTVSNNSVSGSSAKGGGIFNDANLSGSLKTLITNSTISGNVTADRGGGVYNADGLTQIRHSTITNNSHVAQLFGVGGGVGSFGSASTSTEVHSSIIAGNGGSDVDMINGAFANSFVSQGYNIIGNGLAEDVFFAVGDQTGVTDPQLQPLNFYGGPTRTHLPLDDSPAVNTGDPGAVAGVGTTPLFDQRGNFDEVQNLSRVRGGQIDIGAVETNVSNIPADFNNDGFVGGFDFLIMQRGFSRPDATKATGDTNADGVVDGVDIGTWESLFSVNVHAVPEVAAAATAPLADEVDPAPAAAEAAETSETLAGLWGLPDAVAIDDGGATRPAVLERVDPTTRDEVLRRLSDLQQQSDLPTDANDSADIVVRRSGEGSTSDSDSFFDLLGRL